MIKSLSVKIGLINDQVLPGLKDGIRQYQLSEVDFALSDFAAEECDATDDAIKNKAWFKKNL